MSVLEKDSNLRTKNQKGWIGFAPQNKLCCFWLLKINPKVLRLLTLSSRLFPNSLPHSLTHLKLLSLKTLNSTQALCLSLPHVVFSAHTQHLSMPHTQWHLSLPHTQRRHAPHLVFYFPFFLLGWSRLHPSPSPFELCSLLSASQRLGFGFSNWVMFFFFYFDFDFLSSILFFMSLSFIR